MVSVTTGSVKKLPLFDPEERIAFVEASVTHLDNVRVEGFNCLITEHARSLGASVMVKGLRAISDFDYELQMAQMNQRLSGIDTFFLSTSPQHSFLSSSLVREVARYGGDVSGMVPKNVNDRLVETFRSREV